MNLTDSKAFTDEREVGGIEARELLPCPFCGGDNLTEVGDDGDYYVGCLGCHTCGPSGTNREEGRALWNRRF